MPILPPPADAHANASTILLCSFVLFFTTLMELTASLRTFIPDIGVHPPVMTLPRTAWVQRNRLRTDVGRFRSCSHKWGMALSVTCESCAEQAVEHVVLHCPIYRPPHGLHGQAVLDDETIEWLLNAYSDI